MATYPTDGDRLVCIFLRSCAAKRPSRCSRSQDSSWTRTLFSNVSRLLESYRVELFHFQLQDPAGSTQGCGLCYALSHSLGRPLMEDTRTGWSSAPAPGARLGRQLTAHPSSSFSSSFRDIFSLEPPPPPLVLLHPPDLMSHRAASCRSEQLSGKDHLPTTISRSLWPSHTHMLRVPRSSSQKQVHPASHLTQDRLPMRSQCPDVAQTSGYLSLSHCLSKFSFCSRPPIATIAFWPNKHPV